LDHRHFLSAHPALFPFAVASYRLPLFDKILSKFLTSDSKCIYNLLKRVNCRSKSFILFSNLPIFSHWFFRAVFASVSNRARQSNTIVSSSVLLMVVYSFNLIAGLPLIVWPVSLPGGVVM
jgi:hypothetical protein